MEKDKYLARDLMDNVIQWGMLMFFLICIIFCGLHDMVLTGMLFLCLTYAWLATIRDYNAQKKRERKEKENERLG
jgi:Ca2+/Na+ antiporter